MGEFEKIKTESAKMLVKYKYRMLLLCLLLIGCRTENAGVEHSSYNAGLRSENYVAAIMSHYSTLFPKNVSDKNSILPGPPEGLMYYTVDATYRADTFAILLSSLYNLVKLNKISGQPVDSVSLASAIKGETLIPLTEKAFEKAIIVESIASIDSIKLKGREYFLSYYFTDSGTQRKRLSFKEETYIINILSEWNIPVNFDDYVGLYSYRKLD